MYNQVHLIGRLTRQPELRTSANGKSFVGFTVACDGLGTDNTVFIPCYAWNKQAENMAKYLSKGSLVAITGSLSMRRRQQNTENNNFESLLVNANRVIFLDKRPQNTGGVASVNNEQFNPTAPRSMPNATSGTTITNSDNNTKQDVNFANDDAII